MQKTKKLTMVVIVFALLISYSATFAQNESLNKPRILVIRSIDNIRFDMRSVMNGFDRAMDTKEVQIDIVDVHVNYLEDEAYALGVENTIQSMIDIDGQYDMLILIREPAVRYALGLGDIFENTPVIFSMVDDTQLVDQIKNKYEAIQVREPVLLRENILLAKTLRDDIKHVIVVLDRNLMQSSIYNVLDAERMLFSAEMDISFIATEDIITQAVDLSDNPLDETMIFYLSEYHTENVFTARSPEEALILTPWISLIGEAVDGGRVLDSLDYGESLGESALSIIRGEDIEAIEARNINAKYVFDYFSVRDKNLDLKWIENELILLNNGNAESEGLLDQLLAGLVLVIGSLCVYFAFKYKKSKKNKDDVEVFNKEIVENVETAITIKNESREYVRVNKQFKDLFSIEGEVIGKTDESLFDLAFTESLKGIDDRAMFGSDDYEKKLIYNHETLGALYLEYKLTKVHDDDGNLFLVTYINDLTEQRKHEKTMSELNKLLEQQVRDKTGELIQAEKMAILGTMVAGVSHEISTPVGLGITASTYLSEQSKQLRKQFESGALKKSDMVGFLDMLDETGEILYNNLTNAAEMITSFKKVAVDQASEEIREFNLKDYTRGVVMNLKPKFKHTNHKIHVIGNDDIKMYAYPGALNQILTNLILNSLIHGFETVDKGDIRIHIQEKKDIKGIRIEYSDNGQGIAKENLAKIFDPFYTTKRGKGGSGLGMNIVRNLVEKKLNGSIKIYSDIGQGVRFILDLPERVNIYDSQNTDEI